MRTSPVLSVLAFALGCAASKPSDDRRGAGSYCEQVASYVSPCPEALGCDGALARDCGALSDVIAEPLEQAAGECMSNLGAPMECLAGAVDQATSSTALESFAQTFCLACGDGSDTCRQSALAGDGADAAGRAGRIARALDPSRLAELGDRCASEDGCGDRFEDCAHEFLARVLPNETASCLLDAIAERGLTADCDAGDGASVGDTDGNADGTTDAGDGTGDDAGTDGGSADDGAVPCDGELGCACGTDAPCIDPLVCQAGVCGEVAACEPDEFEGNDAEDTAYLLGPLGDTDEYGGTLDASLDGDADVDWFQYEGVDEIGAIVNPYASVSVLSLRLCIYAECIEGLEATSVTCPEGTTQAPSPGGRPGCCAEGSTGFELSLGCGGFNPLGDDSAIVSMSVEGGENGVCQDYALSLHF